MERAAVSPDDFAPRCLSVDLEVDAHAGRIERIGALRADTKASLSFSGRDLARGLAKLDELAQGASFLLGHNLIAFDLPHLAAADPSLRLLRMPAVDTLRLNPLAFPRNPYHHLVKHYQDGALHRGQRNDPLLDAGLALEAFRHQCDALKATERQQPELMRAWHWLTVSTAADAGVDALFKTLRRDLRPHDEEAQTTIRTFLDGRGCDAQAAELARSPQHGWPLAYALAWLSVAGGNSVLPPWVRHQFPEAGALVRRLRDTPCGDPGCRWCGERHDAGKELARWFGFVSFRPEPTDEAGKPLQQSIVEAALAGRHALGILPTGTGKSVCYQIPALSRYDKTGALTVVISPLVALMADQIVGLEARGITCAAALNGLLSLPERADVLDRVRLGGVGILIVSPEQLRNKGLRDALAQREIGAWVLDEAHCLSKWGHDFRPDYRYVARFIREKAAADAVPPLLALTATAKPEVVAEIVEHFRSKLGVALAVFDGGAARTNLDFVVAPTTDGEKFAHVHQFLVADLPAEGGAIIYCASRLRTEELAQYLRDREIVADHFHAGLASERKKDVQRRFIAGELRVICATNAFGMGIDKPDVRLVIHADIPGSLENYLQEAGRAGRDRAAARCVLLYTDGDVERQFGMSARSRLTQREIQAILRALRRIDAKKKLHGEIVATAGEILLDDDEHGFVRDSATDDTRVRTALAWLEESALLTREENRVQVFPSSLRVGSLAEARERLARADLAYRYRDQLLAIVDALINAEPTEGIGTDELMAVSRLSPEGVRHALHDLEALGIASNDTALTAFVHAGVERSSAKRLQEAAALEIALIEQMRQAAPDLAVGAATLLHLRHATQTLRDAGHAPALPERLLRIVRSLAQDGAGEEGAGSLALRRLDGETVQVTLNREWRALQKTAELRRAGAQRLLDHLLAQLPAGSRGVDLLAETTFGKLFAALLDDVALKAQMRDPRKLLDRALLWLHEQEVIRLNKGLTVFRPAMTIRLAQDRGGFVKADYEPLALHYAEQVVQVHVMAEYAQRGLRAMAEAIRLAMDYFALARDEFLRRWLPNRESDLALQTTPASWRAIVESLASPQQQRIVADDRETTSVLVLAGPGSGKTRVLVHRIAYLVRVRRENPHGILALAYNRHAAVEIRRRLRALIGDDAAGVTVLTCHALAMRLAGVSFAGRAGEIGDNFFRDALAQAIALLSGTGLPPEEADEQRERLLAAFRWILVDEYQDIDPQQYELISALAGRTRRDENGKLTLFAVGDDDQNVYAFAGASVEFIRRFEQDYAARPAYLTENYRSTAHIIAAANAVIAPAAQRMKAQHPIAVNRARSREPEGGEWERFDPVGRGRVQILAAARDAATQAVAVMTELQRLAALDPDWDWSRVAVIAREWRFLDPVHAFCERSGIAAQSAAEEPPHFWRLRETQAMVGWLRERQSALVDLPALSAWLASQSAGPWWALLQEAVAGYAEESGGHPLPLDHFTEWLAEWGREFRRMQRGLLLATAHRAKGLEFDHVAVLDGGWDRSDRNEDPDAPRRLFYVAMTRARKTLALARLGGQHPLLDELANCAACVVRDAAPVAVPSGLDRRHVRLTLGDVDLDFAGRKDARHRVHRAIAALSAGEELTLVQDGARRELRDAHGTPVGKLAAAFDAPAGMICAGARVAAILARSREDSAPEFRDRVRTEHWEVVVPELIFAPKEI